MNKNRLPLLITALLIFAFAQIAPAQTTSFTYQGRLSDASAQANGSYDLGFALFDAASGGNQIGAALTRPAVNVSNGIFTVQLDFGAAAFPGANRFLEIAVKRLADATFTTLTPRRQLTSSPFSIQSLSATTANGLSAACVACVTSAQINSVDGAKVTGTVANATNATNETWILGFDSATSKAPTSLLPCNDASSNTRTITYQGRLTNAGAAASGEFDLRFQIYNAATGGASQSATLALENVAVVNGIFTVQLDFGILPAILDGGNLFLEIGARAGTSTDMNGNYTFAGLNGGGNYTVTPAKTDYTFSPASASFNNLNANQTASFSAMAITVSTYTISGQVTNGGQGLFGARVALSGSSAVSTTTDAAGNYSFAGLTGGGNYTATPILDGYVFVQPNITFNNLSGNQTNNNFATSVITYEGDVAARPTGDGLVDIFNLVTVGNIIAKLPNVLPAAVGAEFQRADVAPRAAKGDGSIDVQDLIQISLYIAARDPLTPAGGAVTQPNPAAADRQIDTSAD